MSPSSYCAKIAQYYPEAPVQPTKFETAQSERKK